MSNLKVCTGPCGLPKEPDEFIRRKGSVDGRAAICRDCFRSKIKQSHVTQRKKRATEKHEMTAKPVFDPPRCTCKPRKVGLFVAHDAGCMIFAHNRLDGIRRAGSLDEAALVFGG